MRSPFRYRAERNDYEPGDDRVYDVSHHGQHVGTVERDWMPSAHEGDEPVRAFFFAHVDGRTGYGRTRDAAVREALSQEVTQ